MDAQWYLDAASRLIGPKLDLGCGGDTKPGFIGVDVQSTIHPQMVADLEEPLPFADNSVWFIWTDQTLEHIRNLIPLMNECWRVLKPNCIMWIGVPRFPEPESVIDPTHVRFFVPGTFDYFCSPSSKFDYGIKRWNKSEVTTPAWGVVAVLVKPGDIQ